MSSPPAAALRPSASRACGQAQRGRRPALSPVPRASWPGGRSPTTVAPSPASAWRRQGRGSDRPPGARWPGRRKVTVLSHRKAESPTGGAGGSPPVPGLWKGQSTDTEGQGLGRDGAPRATRPRRRQGPGSVCAPARRPLRHSSILQQGSQSDGLKKLTKRDKRSRPRIPRPGACPVPAPKTPERAWTGPDSGPAPPRLPPDQQGCACA